MTQNTEQNVRTFDTQISMMAEFIRTGPSGKGLEGWLSAHIRAAEARGAAEERRKDAEGCAIAGYVPDNTPNFFATSEARHASTALHRDPFPGDVPVYYTPAYVAWREERVKELEGVCRHIIWTEEEHGLGSRGHDSAVQAARAALTREGEVDSPFGRNTIKPKLGETPQEYRSREGGV